MIAFVVPFTGGLDVTRAKKLISAFMRGQGRVPFNPMPRRVLVSFWAWVVLDATRIGVVATIRVSGRDGGIGVVFDGGIFEDWLWAVLGGSLDLFLELKEDCFFLRRELGMEKIQWDVGSRVPITLSSHIYGTLIPDSFRSNLD